VEAIPASIRVEMVIDIGPYPFDDERIETVRKAEPEKRWFKVWPRPSAVRSPP
jgi:hypothetical protein